jgi:very-short-patch-repair endonuclease
MTIARLASRQHGVVSISQLLAAGLSRTGVARRVQAGRLHRIHQGIYAVGHVAISQEGRWMAAILAYSQKDSVDSWRTVLDHWGVALSHRSAAILWQLLPPSDGTIDISAPNDGGRRKRHGIRIHRCPTLLPASVTSRHGIPVTSPARTISDLRSSVAPRELRRAIRQAEVLGLPTGAESLTKRTRSDLELLFLRLCRRHGLPRPEVNTEIDGIKVDFLWWEQRVVVETDGYRYRRGKVASEDDHARDLKLRELGYEVIRLSDEQVTNDPKRVARIISQTLAA